MFLCYSVYIMFLCYSVFIMFLCYSVFIKYSVFNLFNQLPPMRHHKHGTLFTFHFSFFTLNDFRHKNRLPRSRRHLHHHTPA